MPTTVVVVVLICLVSTLTRLDGVHTRSTSLLPSQQQKQQSYLQQQGSGIRVYVSPRRATLSYGETVSIRCRARGGSTVADMPYIRFSVRENSLALD